MSGDIMVDDLWLSLGLGGGIGLMYGVASRLTHRYAMHQSDRRFFGIFLGGMGIRLGVALALVFGILATVPVQGPVFIGSFLLIFVIGLVVELAGFYRGHGLGRSGS